jgi:hypothetical protein
MYFTNRSLPQEMRDLTISSGKEEMLCSREVIINRFSFLASLLDYKFLNINHILRIIPLTFSDFKYINP